MLTDLLRGRREQVGLATKVGITTPDADGGATYRDQRQLS